jgi:hypothetical protein
MLCQPHHAFALRAFVIPKIVSSVYRLDSDEGAQGFASIAKRDVLHEKSPVA